MRRWAALLLLLVACASPQERLAADLCDAVGDRDARQVDRVALQAEADGVPLSRVEAQARLECGDEMDAWTADMDTLVERLRELREGVGG
jgi:hypothetical protein